MKDFLKRYFLDFDSRAGRKEFWLTTLVVFLILSLMSILDCILATTIVGIFGYLFFFFAVVLLFPFSGTMTRRLKDTNRKIIWTKLFFAINIIFIFLFNWGLGCENKTEFLTYILISVFALTFYNVLLITFLCEKPVLPDPIFEEKTEKENIEITEEVKKDILNQLEQLDH